MILDTGNEKSHIWNKSLRKNEPRKPVFDGWMKMLSINVKERVHAK